MTMTTYCDDHMEHINTLCVCKIKFCNVKVGGTYSYHSAL